MSDSVQIYGAVERTERLHQGEILASLVCAKQHIESIGASTATIAEVSHPFVAILTQDCDLEWDFTARQESKHDLFLPNVLMCEVIETSLLKGKVPPGKDIWKRIIQNKDERYHCIEAFAPGSTGQPPAFESLGIDFKRYFTIPTDELYRRMELGQARRMGRLLTPFAEHLGSRFFFFQSRIATPRNHQVPM